MSYVHIKMVDEVAGFTVESTIHSDNAKTDIDGSLQLGSKEQQREALEHWIQTEGNTLHRSAALYLTTWRFA